MVKLIQMLHPLQTCCRFSCASLRSVCFAEVYKASLLKAFSKTVEEGRFAFVIVDADNTRVDDFKPFWAAGQVRQNRQLCLAMHHIGF